MLDVVIGIEDAMGRSLAIDVLRIYTGLQIKSHR